VKEILCVAYYTDEATCAAQRIVRFLWDIVCPWEWVVDWVVERQYTLGVDRVMTFGTGAIVVVIDVTLNDVPKESLVVRMGFKLVDDVLNNITRQHD
jgi:hypothetical protein